ncbi:hypothetical protein A2U01_0071618, partial [Trifolium medium]|nr:hypothetical protein [Trifolium medium]
FCLWRGAQWSWRNAPSSSGEDWTRFCHWRGAQWPWRNAPSHSSEGWTVSVDGAARD